jgi:hypothetical protein
MLRTYREKHVFLGCDSCGSYKYILPDPKPHPTSHSPSPNLSPPIASPSASSGDRFWPLPCFGLNSSAFPFGGGRSNARSWPQAPRGAAGGAAAPVADSGGKSVLDGGGRTGPGGRRPFGESPIAQSGRAGSGCLDEVEVDVNVRAEEDDVEDDWRRRELRANRQRRRDPRSWKRPRRLACATHRSSGARPSRSAGQQSPGQARPPMALAAAARYAGPGCCSGMMCGCGPRTEARTSHCCYCTGARARASVAAGPSAPAVVGAASGRAAEAALGSSHTGPMPGEAEVEEVGRCMHHMVREHTAQAEESHVHHCMPSAVEGKSGAWMDLALRAQAAIRTGQDRVPLCAGAGDAGAERSRPAEIRSSAARGLAEVAGSTSGRGSMADRRAAAGRRGPGDMHHTGTCAAAGMQVQGGLLQRCTQRRRTAPPQARRWTRMRTTSATPRAMHARSVLCGCGCGATPASHPGACPARRSRARTTRTRLSRSPRHSRPRSCTRSCSRSRSCPRSFPLRAPSQRSP